MTKISIESIKLYNFKSFKGEHVIKGLEPHFNTIIGPNGSGKSNLIDSILFVLGYKAKRMRHKLNTDLIYQGDTKEKECFVEITFIKNSEIYKIKRKLTQSKSTYFFNDKEVAQKTITDFMENEGVDIENNRFLIMQGEIESISLMKPKNNGMLEYLEDCIGTTKYIEDIQKLTSEYENKSQNFDEQSNTHKFYEKEFAFIKEKKQENEKLVIEHKKKIKIQQEINKLRAKKADYQENSYKEEYEILNNKLKELLTKNKDNKSKMSKLDESLVHKKNQINKKEKEFCDAKNKFFDVEKQNMVNENKKERIMKTIQKLENEVSENKKRNEANKKEQEMCKKENIELQCQKNMFEDEIKSIKTEILKLGNKTEEVKIRNDTAEKENKIVKLLKRKEEFNTQSYKNKKMVETKNEIEEFLLFVQENDLEELQKNKCKNEEMLRVLETKTNILRKEIYTLETKQKQFDKEEDGKNKQAKVINVLKNVNGFIGRLGDLGSTDKKYDVAVSTAGKGNLNNMVVENTETAEKCIEMLKANNLERVSFVVINKIRECNDKDFTKHDYLINYIECEQKYKKLFYFAISDTILCRNIEEAKKIGFANARKKVVTLDGKMIEKSGLMSGGGYFSGSMKIAKREAEANNKELRKKEENKKKLEAEMRENREKLIKMQIKINEIESKMNRIMNIVVCDEKDKANKNIEYVKKRCIANLKQIEKEIKDNEIESEIEKIENKVKEIQKSIAKNQEKLESIEDIEVKRFRGELGILYEKYEINEKRIEENEKKVSKTEIIETEKNEEEINKLKKEMELVKEVNDFEEKRSRKEEKEKELKGLLDELKEINKEIKIVKSMIGKDFDKEVEILNEINEKKEVIDRNEKIKKECKKMKNELEKEYKKYSEMITNDDGNSTVDELENNSYEDFEKENISEINIKKEKPDFCVEECNEKIQRNENELKKMKFIENVDFSTFQEYKEKKIEFDKNQNEYKNSKILLDICKSKLSEVKKKRKDEFVKGLEIINKNLKEIYQIITFGGNAELELIDFYDPFSEGVCLSVMPPKKSWKNVNTLSGGEKTLSSLALVFALHVYKPSPFYVMDEIDAALDFRNVSIISNYVYEKTKNAQFLIISLRNDIFEKANILVGVYKNDNLSKTVVFNVKDILKKDDNEIQTC
ncbi:Structural maintenance of chromosomes protein 4 [Binucleata daphniae]